MKSFSNVRYDHTKCIHKFITVFIRKEYAYIISEKNGVQISVDTEGKIFYVCNKEWWSQY